MFDYKLIEAFAVVIQEGGFEKAAGELYITQSAVSQRIKQLEEYFGQIVLLRSTPPLPTEFGTKLLGLYNQVSRLENDLRRSHSSAGSLSVTSVPIGINADTLATWFLGAVEPILAAGNVVLDLLVDDQEETDKLLRDGKVLGCITTRKSPVQGCSVHYLGDVEYGLFSSVDFAGKWFSDGVNLDSVVKAPMITFNRKDKLNLKILERKLGVMPQKYLTHYVPSTEMFLSFIEKGIAYGAMPESQSRKALEQGGIYELAPECRERVPLYWQCWNLKSDLLEKITRCIVKGAGY